jgi:hypothetical protein
LIATVTVAALIARRGMVEYLVLPTPSQTYVGLGE